MTLYGIALVIGTSTGPAFVHHYPPDARAAEASEGTSSESGQETGSSDGGEEDSANGGDPRLDMRSADDGRSMLSDRRDVNDEGEEEEGANEEDKEDDVDQKKGRVMRPWERVFAFDTEVLAHMLSPPVKSCNRKFELSVDGLVFVGYPVHIRHDGTWIKRRKRDHEKEEAEEKTMTMFHMVFVMSSSQLDQHTKVQEVYTYVITRFTSALRLEQSDCGYVWKEAETILRIKEEAIDGEISVHELCNKINRQSNLAEAMKLLYTHLSANKIAHVPVNKSMISLQLPVITQSATLPSPDNDAIPKHVYLTSAASFGEHDDESDNLVTPHYSLLLLDSVEVILREIPTQSTSALAYFVRNVQTTQTFMQMSRTTRLSLSEVFELARHLIYWRRARAIPPVHPRNIYIVSPTADMSTLGACIAEYRHLFPMLPSLPRFLALLSHNPRAFSVFIPSRDHRATYLDVVIWLLRKGWVCQLLTFAWVKVSQTIRVAVKGDDEGDGFPDGDYVIQDPHRATALERKWLERIAGNKSPEEALFFEGILKYLNGRHAIEKISAREGTSRRRVRELLGAFDSDLIIARHW